MKLKYCLVLLVVMSLSACVVSGQSSVIRQQLKEYRAAGVEKQVDVEGGKPEEVINSARFFLGVKHRLGGTDHQGLDCSGLVYVSFKKHDIQLPRSSAEQGRYGKQIHALNRLKRGDLVFFHMDWSDKLVNHVGIYLGDEEFIHVSSSKGCIISNIKDKVWKHGFLFGTRVW